MRHMRRKIWIDRFQTSLALRIAYHCVLYQVATWFLVVFEQRIHPLADTILGPAGGTYLSILIVTSVVAMVMMSVYDAVKISHRVVGPIYRFRMAVRSITAGEVVAPIHLRDGDYLRESMDDLNEMLIALERRGAVVLKAPEARQDQIHPETAGVELASSPP